MTRPVLETLQACGQSQLARFWDELDESQRQKLAEEIATIDFDLVRTLFDARDAGEDLQSVAAKAEPPPAFRLGHPNPEFTLSEAQSAGHEVLAAGQVGAILVAGGQGSRLGFDQPKGMFSIGAISGKSLFQVLFEKVLATSRRHGHPVPLYVMTSPVTHAATEQFLKANNYFGLPSGDVQLFCQGQMPAVDAETGQILLAGKDHVALSPDGHGGMLAAMRAAGCLEDCRRRGIKQLFYFQVDNPLCAVCDPAFLGFHRLHKSEYSLQVVAKDDPLERVGNLLAIDGKLRIIEYSDLPPQLAELQNADGSLKFWAGSIAVHVFDTAFLDRLADQAAALPFHVARKVVPHIGASGRDVRPEQPNAIKFERFIFDLLPHAQGGFAVEVDAQTDFAPVKNANGAPRDTPSSCQTAWSALHRAWLCAAGVRVSDNVQVEISPLFALDKAEVKTKPLPAELSEDTYFC